MKTLYLIRHSITEGNARRLYYGATDLPLIEAGRALCRTLRGSYDLPESVSFATSGMLRAEETLQLLFGDVPHEILKDLREMEMGEFEMKSYDQLKDRPSYQAWLNDANGNYKIPGGESNREVTERVGHCIHEWAENRQDHLFAVCHGGAIGCAMSVCFPEAGKAFYDWIPQSCHGYAIDFEGAQPISYRAI